MNCINCPYSNKDLLKRNKEISDSNEEWIKKYRRSNFKLPNYKQIRFLDQNGYSFGFDDNANLMYIYKSAPIFNKELKRNINYPYITFYGETIEKVIEKMKLEITNPYNNI